MRFISSIISFIFFHITPQHDAKNYAMQTERGVLVVKKISRCGKVVAVVFLLQIQI